MATWKLSAAPRHPGGKGAARQLRRGGRIPGVLYGQGEEPSAVTVDERELGALLRDREGTVIVELDVEGRGPQQTIIREIQREPVSGRVLHLDLQHISLTEKVQVEVPIRVIGTPYGVKTEGGILEHHMRSIEVECLPGQIPGHVDIDVSELRLGKSLHVSDLPIDRTILELLTNEQSVILSVSAPRIAVKTAEEEAAEAAAEAEEAAAGEAAGEGEAESESESS